MVHCGAFRTAAALIEMMFWALLMALGTPTENAQRSLPRSETPTHRPSARRRPSRRLWVCWVTSLSPRSVFTSRSQTRRPCVREEKPTLSVHDKHRCRAIALCHFALVFQDVPPAPLCVSSSPPSSCGISLSAQTLHFEKPPHAAQRRHLRHKCGCTHEGPSRA